MRRRPTARHLCAPLLIVAIFLAPSQSLAAGDPIASGRAELTLARHLLGQLEGAQARVAPNGQTIANPTSGFVLGVTAGSLDPASGAGSFTMADGITFRGGKKPVPVTAITVETSAGLVVADIAGKAMRLGRFRSVTSKREGFDLATAIGSIELTGYAARRIDRRLDLKSASRLRGGEVLGALTATTRPSGVQVAPESLQASFWVREGSPALEKLEQRQVFLWAIGRAYVHVPPSPGLPRAYFFLFSSGNGWIAPDGSAGELQLNAGIKFQAYATDPVPVVRLAPLVVNLGRGTVESAPLREPIPLKSYERIAALSATAAPRVSVDPETRKFEIEIPTLVLTKSFAELLNETFPGPAESALAAGDALATMQLTVTAR